MTVARRVCFYNKVGGVIRPYEWCLVTDTALGTMVEPFWPFESALHMSEAPRDDDFTNEFQRVDEFIEVDDDKLPTMLSGGGDMVLHGGRHWPRDGR